MYYLALVLDAEDGLDFVCPDVPGFTAHAPTKDFGEAVAVAREVLAGHLGALLDGGHTLPASRDYAALMGDPDLAEDFVEAITTVLLPALVPAGRSVRVNVSLDENTLQLIDAAARDRSLTRSAYIAEACRQFAAGGRVGGSDIDLMVELKRQMTLGNEFSSLAPEKMFANADACMTMFAEPASEIAKLRQEFERMNRLAEPQGVLGKLLEDLERLRAVAGTKPDAGPAGENPLDRKARGEVD